MNALPRFTEDDVASVLNYQDLVPLMRETLMAFSAGDVVQPVRQMLEVEAQQRYLGIMPASTPEALGAKLVAFYPKNAGTDYHTHLGLILLFAPETGEPLAVMDARLITEMRTAATSVAVTRACMDKARVSVAFLGSGVQASAHLAALKDFYSISDVTVWSRSDTSAHSFADAHGAHPLPARDAVAEADIVVVATNAKAPVLNGAWLKHGAHVNSVGSPRPDWRELDDVVMANTLFVDSREAVARESGDVILSGVSAYCEAGELLSHPKLHDTSVTTVFKSVGIAAEDLATARWVYEKLKS